MIGVGSTGPLLFSVPDIPLNVIETDGYPIEPKRVDEIIIYPAERYDFTLDLNGVKDGLHNITVHILEGKFLNKRKDIIGRGLINLKTFISSVKMTSYTINKTILNCPLQFFPSELHTNCIPVTSLESHPSAKNSFDETKRSGETFTYFLNFGFPGKTRYSSINGRKFIWPTVSALTQPSDLNTFCHDCNNENSCKCTYSLNLKSGAEIIMVLSNVGNGAVITHPIHIHGHTFEVLKMGFPFITSPYSNDSDLHQNEDILCNDQLTNEESQCNQATWRNFYWTMNYRHIDQINLHNPVRKDTVIVPYGGYTIIRFWATNPGVWFMHCHIDKHMVEGMALMLNESFDKLPALPNDMPTCYSFKNQPIVRNEHPPRGLLIFIFKSLMQKNQFTHFRICFFIFNVLKL